MNEPDDMRQHDNAPGSPHYKEDEKPYQCAACGSSSSDDQDFMCRRGKLFCPDCYCS